MWWCKLDKGLTTTRTHTYIIYTHLECSTQNSIINSFYCYMGVSRFMFCRLGVLAFQCQHIGTKIHTGYSLFLSLFHPKWKRKIFKLNELNSRAPWLDDFIKLWHFIFKRNSWSFSNSAPFQQNSQNWRRQTYKTRCFVRVMDDKHSKCHWRWIRKLMKSFMTSVFIFIPK